jgi:hypothetical protein
VTTIVEFTAEFHRLSKLLDQGLRALREAAHEAASSEDVYRMAHAKAYLSHDGPQHERKAAADLATSAERQRAHLADGMRQAALEAVRSRRAQVSALQSLLAAERAEAEFARTSTRMGP